MHLNLQLPDGLDKAEFLADYWQKRPLLMRQALPGYQSPLSPDELAGLACESWVESRIVLEKDGERPWEARHGPFEEEAFAALPDSHWTLLVQDVDKHVPEVAELIQPFRFIPDWRIDDVMISYADDQGSVGPHVDDYDVFLVQAEGRRRWRVHTREVDPDNCIPGLDLRILPEFEAEHDWLLEPGDVLYLPPNVAHWGVAEGPCITCSVGFRAPAWREMAHSWMEHLIDTSMPSGRYRDPALQPQLDSAEIKTEVFERVRERLSELCSTHQDDFDGWLGCFLTEAKDNLQPDAAAEQLSELDFAAEFEANGWLLRSGYARMSYRHDPDGSDLLFVNGKLHRLPGGQSGFLHAITQETRLHHGYLAEWLTDSTCLKLLCDLYNQGYYLFDDE